MCSNVDSSIIYTRNVFFYIEREYLIIVIIHVYFPFQFSYTSSPESSNRQLVRSRRSRQKFVPIFANSIRRIRRNWFITTRESLYCTFIEWALQRSLNRSRRRKLSANLTHRFHIRYAVYVSRKLSSQGY